MMKPRAIKKAATISQTVLLANPDSIGPILRIPVRPVIMTPRRTTAPMGRGERISPKIVATKMARRCQASGFTPAGMGEYQMTTPMITTMRPRVIRPPIFGPCPFIASPFEFLKS